MQDRPDIRRPQSKIEEISLTELWVTVFCALGIVALMNFGLHLPILGIK